MSTVYLMSNVGSIFVGPTGHEHLKSSSGDMVFAIDCPSCEKYLVRDFAAVYDRSQVPLTDRQIAEREQAKEDGGRAMQQAAEAMGKALADVRGKA